MKCSEVRSFAAREFFLSGCESSKWGQGAAPGTFQYFSHVNSYEGAKNNFKIPSIFLNHRKISSQKLK